MGFSMQSIALAAFVTLASATELSPQRMVSYMPTYDVSDQAMIDLDQLKIEEQVQGRKVPKAYSIYQEGGHSEPYAKITLKAPPGPRALPAGSNVWGHNDNDLQVTGVLKGDYAWQEGDQNVTIEVLYDRSESYDYCQVGGLYMISEANLINCFTTDGIIKIGPPGSARGDGEDFVYAYNIRVDNMNGRTIRDMTVNAGEYLRNPLTNQYLPDFQQFVNYYGQTDYADQWITSAANGQPTNFKSGRGNADFTVFAGRFGQGEALIKGTAFMAVYMFLISKLEEAVENCQVSCVTDDCRAKSLRALDEAVAYYAGSLAQTDAGSGVFFYSLADNRGHNFKTSGHLGDKSSGTSYVNVHAVNLFKETQTLLGTADAASCQAAILNKNEIIRLMKIPFIQSVLGYAYVREHDTLTEEDEMEKVESKGASYAAAVLPFIHHCDEDSAKVIYEQMKVGSDMSKVKYDQIKRAFERTYECMNLSCEDIGGIWDGSKYAPGAAPCNGVQESKKAGKVVASTFGVTIAIVVAAYFFIRYRKSGGKKHYEMEHTRSIAAVSEIA